LKSDFDPGIFHDPKHLNLQSSTGWHSFYSRNNETLAGLVHFHVDKGLATSPYKSPFGSFLFSEKLSVAVLTDFVSYCENQLAGKNVKPITIKNQPEAYSLHKNQMLFDVLDKSGYSITKEETSAILAISEKPFEFRLHKSEKKRLRKCRESELGFEIMPLKQLEKIYVFLEACREEKGYSLSMPFDEIQKLATTLPERILLTAVIDGNQIVAANISIRVYDNVLYNFYHDHAGEYDHLSPVVLLNEGLYNFCQKGNIGLLDLGTSNIDDKVNESLLAFKLHLGAQPSRKLTFSKTLS
jgi:hypothetical protein